MLNISDYNYSYYGNKYCKTPKNNLLSFGAKFSLFRKRQVTKDVFVKTIQPSFQKVHDNAINGTILEGAQPLKDFFKAISYDEKDDSLINKEREILSSINPEKSSKITLFKPQNKANGTILDGAEPLEDFFKAIKSEDKDALIKRGMSTNTLGEAYCLLKSNAGDPLSSSFAQDCSIIYLYNENTNTHFLYHLKPFRDSEESYYSYMRKLIRQYMPEGYTSAGIVPGDKHFEQRHREYVPQLIETLKGTNPDAKVNLYYSKSMFAEITGWNGKLYEIKNTQGQGGQASFKIHNFFNINNPFAENNSNRPFITVSPNIP